jgi:hypothetical protein
VGVYIRRIGLGQGDWEWKTLLRKFIPNDTAAHQFWLDFYALHKYPKLDERGEELLGELLRDYPFYQS